MERRFSGHGNNRNVKEKKLAEAEAYRWEQKIKNGKAVAGGAFTQPRPAACDPSPADDAVPEEETLRYFAEQIWMPLLVVGGGLRPSTIAMYRFMLKVILPKLGRQEDQRGHGHRHHAISAIPSR